MLIERSYIGREVYSCIEVVILVLIEWSYIVMLIAKFRLVIIF